jgi:phosphate transport system permease protein
MQQDMLKKDASLLSGEGSISVSRKTRQPVRQRLYGFFFDSTMHLSVIIVSFLILAIIISLFAFSLPAIKVAGADIFLGKIWNPDQEKFGGLPFIIGTLITSGLALLLSLPFSLAIAIFLGEYFTTGKLGLIISSAIELLAGIPSIIYGTWGLFVIVPLVQQLQKGMASQGIIPFGLSIFSAAVILAIMIIPYSASIAREVISLVPYDYKEAGYSFGATRFAVVRRIVLPYAVSGIFAGQLLAFARALGETMAVAMVIGNLKTLPGSIFAPGSTITSVIVSEYNEAGPLHAAALTELGLILLVITVVFGFIGRLVINRLSVR